MAGCPIALRAVNPVPNAVMSLPGARSSTVAIADAVTIGWRKVGTATPAPSPIAVASATRPTAIQRSP